MDFVYIQNTKYWVLHVKEIRIVQVIVYTKFTWQEW